MLRLPFFCLCIATGLGLNAQTQPQRLQTTDDQARELAATITADDLRKHLTIIAADNMEGRETGEPGQKKAAQYLKAQFQGLGLPAIGEGGGYFQTIVFRNQNWSNLEMTLDGKPLRHLWEYAAAPSQNTSRGATDIEEITFLGYGIDDPAYSDYTRADVRGKHIMILAGEPMDNVGRSLITKTDSTSGWSADVNLKLKLAKEKGAQTVFIVDPDFKENIRNIRQENLDGRAKMADGIGDDRETANVVYLTPKLSRQILGKKEKKVIKARRKLVKSGKLKPVTVPVNIRLTQEKEIKDLVGENIYGFVEGSDPALKEEVLVVSAHYDHIGKRGESVFNGADDNGSGTSTILELAEAFSMAKKRGVGPRRSVLFLLVSGEEKGLLGSEYYAAHPKFALENTIADINVDMVGRVDEEHADNPEYIYVIGSDRLSTELHDINERMNQTFTNLELDYTYNAESDPNRYYYRSDHYNFAVKGIPSIFFFNGTHADYHQATDTVDKINFDKMAKIGQLVFHTAWQLANQDRRIEVDVQK